MTLIFLRLSIAYKPQLVSSSPIFQLTHYVEEILYQNYIPVTGNLVTGAIPLLAIKQRFHIIHFA